jgi:hypothetical protein
MGFTGCWLASLALLLIAGTNSTAGGLVPDAAESGQEVLQSPPANWIWRVLWGTPSPPGLGGPAPLPAWPGASTGATNSDNGPARLEFVSRDGIWNRVDPPALTFHSAVYDDQFDRLIVLCGTDGLFRGDASAYSFVTGDWHELRASGSIPPRGSHYTAFDSRRRRVLIYGGQSYLASYEYQRHDDLWELPIDGRGVWRRIDTEGADPGPRSRGAAIYDPVADRVLLFGGYDGTNPLNDLWELKLDPGPQWRRLEVPAGPPASAYDHQAVFDPLRRRMLVFVLGEVWALWLDGEMRWEKLEADGIRPRALAGFVPILDAANDRIVVIGGERFGDTVWEVHELRLRDKPTWQKLEPTGGDAYLSYYGAALDTRRNRVIVHGGHGIQNKIWSLSLEGAAIWSELDQRGPTPTAGPGCVLVRDTRRNRLLLWDGQPWPNNGELFELALAENGSWRRVETLNSPPRAAGGGPSFYDERRDRVVVYIGHDWYNFSNSVWELRLTGTPEWRLLTTSTPGPARGGAAGAYDPEGDRLFLYGGANYDGIHGDTWALEFSPTPHWVQLQIKSPPARALARAVYDPNRRRILMIGGLPGYTGSDAFREVWALDLAHDPSWKRLEPLGSIPSYLYMTPIVHDPIRDRMVIIGRGAFQERMRTWALTLDDAPTFSELAPLGTGPVSRVGHGAACDPGSDRMWIFGGGGGAEYFETWSLSWRKPRIEAELSIQPGNRDDPHGHERRGGVPAAILSAKSFDARTTDLLSLPLFGSRRDGVAASEWTDVNGDGREDVLVRLRPDALAPRGRGASLELEARTIYGEWVALQGDARRPPGRYDMTESGAGEVEAPAFSLSAPTVGLGRGALTIRLRLGAPSPVRLEVFDVAGRRCWDRQLGVLEAGEHEFAVGSERPLRAGVYFVRAAVVDQTLLARAVALP